MTATSPSRVAVVTDSAASLPDDARVAGQVTVVPMTLTIGGTEYEDGSIAPAEVLRRTATESASTSAPSPGAFAAAIEQAGDADVLVITVASQMSSTYEAARMAADTLPSTRVQVLDSRTAAGGQGLVVLGAVDAAARGGALEDVEARAREVADRVHLIASLPDLDHLARSGRVPGIAARAGRAVGVHPLFEFSDGAAQARRPALSRNAALQRIVDRCLHTAPGSPDDLELHAAILHADAEDSAAEIDSLLSKRVDAAELYVAPFSSVMIAHTGPGLIGLAWWWSEPEGEPSPE